MEDHITTKEASAILGVNLSRVIQLCERKQLDAVKMSGVWIISKESVLARAADPPRAGRRWHKDDRGNC